MKIKKGWFYFVPVYFNPEDNGISGRNIIFDCLLTVVIKIHIFCVYFMTFLAAYLEFEYEPSFPFWITGDKK